MNGSVEEVAQKAIKVGGARHRAPSGDHKHSLSKQKEAKDAAAAEKAKSGENKKLEAEGWTPNEIAKLKESLDIAQMQSGTAKAIAPQEQTKAHVAALMMGTSEAKALGGQKQKAFKPGKTDHAPSAYNYNSKGHRKQGAINNPRKFAHGQSKAAYKEAGRHQGLGQGGHRDGH